MPYMLNDKLKDLNRMIRFQEIIPSVWMPTNPFWSCPWNFWKKRSTPWQIAFNRYPDPYATELCESFGAYYGVDPALVTAGNGSDEWLFIIASSFLMRGDKTLDRGTGLFHVPLLWFFGRGGSVVYQKKEDLSIDVDDLIVQVRASANKSRFVFQSLQSDFPGIAPGRGAKADHLRFCARRIG
ncbi:MAG: hypothetical protein V8Q79_01425 [Christensenellales bacterium]